MQYLSPPSSPGTITFLDFLDYVKAKVPLDTEEKIEDCVAPLVALSNSAKPLIQEIVTKFLHNFTAEASAIVDYLSNSIVLFEQHDHLVRLNLWRPLPPRSRFNAFNGRMYAYGYPHDHDFDLLTVGALGPGYETDIFQYDRSRVSGFPGEAVSTELKGRFRLLPQSVLFYEQSKDIHIQYPCDKLSVSINLISQSRVKGGGQFVFDSEGTHVRGIPEYAGAKIIKLAEMMIDLEVDGFEETIKEMARRSADPFVQQMLRAKLERYEDAKFGREVTDRQQSAAERSAYDRAATSIYDMVIQP